MLSANTLQPIRSRVGRRLIPLLIALALPAFALTACGGNDSPDQSSAAANPSTQQFWFSGTVTKPYATAGQRPTAQFVSMRRYNVDYRVCLSEPRGKRTCRTNTTAAAGTPSRVRFPLRYIGPHQLRWYVEDALVDGINFDVGIE